MRKVSFLSFQPRRLRDLIGICAAIDDPGYIITETFSDVAQTLGATAIFHGIMEQSANGFGFIGSVLKCDCGHTKDMCDKRDPGFLSDLIAMRPGRINQRFLKFVRQLHSMEQWV
jgi:hypothetical protein